MEHDHRFLELKAVMECFEVKAQVKLKTLGYSSSEASKKQLDTIVSSLKVVELYQGSEEDKRKFHLYLLLNTDIPVSNVLEEDVNFCHLIGRCPKISKFLYFIIVNVLDLVPFMTETILYVPNEFSEAVIDIFIDNVKYIADPFNELVIIKQLLISIYKKLHFSVSILSGNCRLVKQFQVILLMYKKPSQFTTRKLETWTKLELHKYYGFLLLSIMSVLLECTENTFHKNSNEKHSFLAFDNMYDFTCFKSGSQSVTNENIISDCYELILDVCKSFLSEKVSASTYLDWCEFDISESHTLQRVIGEKVFHTRKALMEVDQNMESVSKSLKTVLTEMTFCLGHLEIKPLSLAEEVKNLDFEQLITKLSNNHDDLSDEDNALILQALLQSTGALTDLRTVKIIRKFGVLLKLDDIKFLMKSVFADSFEEAVEDKQFLNKMKLAIVESVRHLSWDEQISTLEWFIETFGCSNKFNLGNFEEKLVEVFNKFVTNASSDYEVQFLCSLVILCFHSVGDVAVKTLNECIVNPSNIKDMVPILTSLRPSLQKVQCWPLDKKLNIFKRIVDDQQNLEQILQNTKGDFLIDVLHVLITNETLCLDGTKRTNLLELVNYLIDESVIDKNLFYHEVIITNIKLTTQTNVVILNYLLQYLFKAVLESLDDSLSIEIHVILVQLAQILEKVRWKPINFASWRSAMVSNLVFLIETLVKKLVTQMYNDQKKFQWLKSYVSGFSINTQFLFCLDSLCLQLNENLISFENQPITPEIIVLNLMHNKKFDLSTLCKINEVELAWAMFKVLSVSCDEEWNLLTLNLSNNRSFNGEFSYILINHLINALLVGIKLKELTVTEHSSKCHKWLSCYNYLLVNFNSFVMNFLLRHLLSLPVPQKVEIFKRLALLLQTVPLDIKSNCSILFLKLLLSFIPHLSEKITNNQEALAFTEIIFNSVRNLDPEARQLIAKNAHEYLQQKMMTFFQAI